MKQQTFLHVPLAREKKKRRVIIFEATLLQLLFFNVTLLYLGVCYWRWHIWEHQCNFRSYFLCPTLLISFFFFLPVWWRTTWPKDSERLERVREESVRAMLIDEPHSLFSRNDWFLFFSFFSFSISSFFFPSLFLYTCSVYRSSSLNRPREEIRFSDCRRSVIAVQKRKSNMAE